MRYYVIGAIAGALSALHAHSLAAVALGTISGIVGAGFYVRIKNG